MRIRNNLVCILNETRRDGALAQRRSGSEVF